MLKTFWENPYQSKLSTTVVEVNGTELTAGIVKTGAHIAEDKARIDFKLDENIASLFPDILTEYNRVIDADLPIVTGFFDEVIQYRYWRIEGLATVPCGGTHVRSTSEVGLVELKREYRGNGVERIKITLKDPAPTAMPT